MQKNRLTFLSKAPHNRLLSLQARVFSFDILLLMHLNGMIFVLILQSDYYSVETNTHYIIWRGEIVSK